MTGRFILPSVALVTDRFRGSVTTTTIGKKESMSELCKVLSESYNIHK